MDPEIDRQAKVQNVSGSGSGEVYESAASRRQRYRSALLEDSRNRSLVVPLGGRGGTISIRSGNNNMEGIPSGRKPASVLVPDFYEVGRDGELDDERRAGTVTMTTRTGTMHCTE
jgi:hypothetical protein